jgi:hypothetical protein
MDRLNLILRVRSNTRDFSNSIFREVDIIDYLNEGIDRFKQIVPELNGLDYLTSSTSVPSLIPIQYHHLLANYASARCYAQDERHYQATTLMNEFEVKLQELLDKVQSGEVVIIDPDTDLPVVLTDNEIDYVDLSAYWDDYTDDYDLGVEGVE